MLPESQPNDSPKPEKTAAEVAEAELTAKCEALDVPGYQVETDGVFTVIRRTSTPERSAAFPARIARWLISSDKWLPYLYRFTKESVELAPWRMALLIVGKLVNSLSPTLQLWITSNLLSMVEQAIKTGRVNKLKLGIYAVIGAFLNTGLSKLNLTFARNAGILERYFEAMIHTRLLNTIAGLDYTAANSPETTKLLVDAAATIQSGSEQAFTIIGDVAKVFTSALGVATQAVLLRKTINRGNLDLIGISFAANLIRSASWLFRGDPGVQTAPTNPHYQRMQGIWDAAQDTTPESILLQLPAYHAAEYARADAALGSTWTYRLLDKSRLAQTTTMLARLSDPLIYTLFALRASARHNSGSLASAVFADTFSMGSLAYIQNASKSIAEELASFFYTLDDVRQHCSKIIGFYRALEIKPTMQRPRNPRPYSLLMTDGSRGMSIELRNVSFKYPSSEHLALQNVSCVFQPGTLTCIVGYNGAGKSTLINLLTRVLDAKDGTVLINGYDAKEYAPEALYRRISCQFQETQPADVTIREWLRMGDIAGIRADDDVTMHEYIRVAGLEKVISRFPKGLDARLGPYPANPTPASFLKEFVKDTQTGPVDPWEADYDKLVKKEIEEDEEWEDEVIGGAGANGGSFKGKDCAFSPGEWQKLCFARSLMKKDADLRIFDEPSASLDPVASRQVFDKIDSLRGLSTIIHITHDLSACLKADQVIMFEDGKNVESGTHEGLLAINDSQYRTFYMASLGQEDDDDEDLDDSQTDAESSASLADSEKTAVSDEGSDGTAWEDEEEVSSGDDEEVLETDNKEPEEAASGREEDKAKPHQGRDRSDSGFHQELGL